MKKLYWLIIIIITILAIAFFLFRPIKDKDIQQSPELEEQKQINQNQLPNESETTNTNPSTPTGGKSGEGITEGSSSTSSSDSTNTIPDDIDEVECGFYFSEYGVCAGTCPVGECTSEGRSCYCKIT